ncbi:MAG: DUF2505 domain-containing protein [Salinisphaeraceae bacterium]|nr:DUF2505 domain-containing protein [Salinisphaeraceae bacterium]
MKHSSQARYPASSDVVIKMFCDPEFHKRKMDKLGIRYEILEEDHNGDEFRLKVERHVPVKASGIVKKIMPATTQVVNDECWNQSDKSGTVVVETKGVPLDMRCSAQMRDEGDECVIDYNWEIKARIPIGGGALEKFVVGDMGKSEAEERDVGVELLDDYR